MIDNRKIFEAYYVGLAFSDHFIVVIIYGLSDNMSKLTSPEARPLFKSKSEDIREPIFKENLREQAAFRSSVRETTNLH